MSERTITLRADLIERLESLAAGRNLNEVVGDLLAQHTAVPPAKGNWALALARDMEAMDVEWLDEPDASLRSRENYERRFEE
jgi:hypothetical protein